MTTRFFLSSSAEELANFLGTTDLRRTATVEAAYGEILVFGSVITMAHHGSRANQPAPCSYENGCAKGVEGVGLSHIDLDTLGGCAAIIGRKPKADGFWALAAFVDVNGLHKLAHSGANAEDIRRLYAYYAWDQDHKVFAPRDGMVIPVTTQVIDGIVALERIIKGDAAMLAAGDEFANNETELNKTSFVEIQAGVIVRVCGTFSNHLYVTPSGEVGRAVVSLRTDTHSCTVSLADPIPGVSCSKIVQDLWGPDAGGHAGIAGGPRNATMGLDELVALRDKVILTIP